MYCPNCNSEISETENFCAMCGKELESVIIDEDFYLSQIKALLLETTPYWEGIVGILVLVLTCLIGVALSILIGEFALFIVIVVLAIIIERLGIKVKSNKRSNTDIAVEVVSAMKNCLNLYKKRLGYNPFKNSPCKDHNLYLYKNFVQAYPYMKSRKLRYLCKKPINRVRLSFRNF